MPLLICCSFYSTTMSASVAVGILLLMLLPLGRSFLTDPRHWPHDSIGTLPICRVCTCRQQSVECAPRRTGEQFQLRRVQLPGWAESLAMFNLSFAAFPLFAGAPRLRQLRLRHCSIDAPLPPLAFAPFRSLESVRLMDCRLKDNALFPALFRPLAQLRELSLPGNGLRDVRIELGGQQVLDRLDLSRNALCPAGGATLGDSFGAPWPPARQLMLENANVLALNSTHWTFGEVEIGGQQRQHNATKREQQCQHLPISDTHWRALEQLQLGENPALRLHSSALPRLASLRHLDLSNAASAPEELFLAWARRPEVQWRHVGLRRVAIKAADDGPFSFYRHPFDGTENGKERHKHWTLCSTELEWLDISELGIEGTLRLDGCGQLKWLYADGNALDRIRVGDSGPATLLSLSARDNRLRRWPAGLLRSANTLSSVQLANNSISRLPPGLFEQYTQLNSLDLSRNELRHFRVGGLSHQMRLTFLNLSQNQLDSVEFPTSALLLSSLTVLDLSDNLLAKFDSLSDLPALEHLHLSGNAGVRLLVNAEHSTLIRLQMGNCSLTKMPDLSLLVALREVNLRDNRLGTVPGHWLPARGVNLLDVGSNALRELGWDWRTEQLDALQGLRAMRNPWECACAFAPPLEHLLAPQTEQQQIAIIDQRTHLCADSNWPLGKCARPRGEQRTNGGDQRQNGAEQQHTSAQFEAVDPFALFLLPLALIAVAFVGTVLLVRGASSKDAHFRSNLCVSQFAYRPIRPNAEAI